MKLKKLLISASAIAAGSGLLATVLTSCAKASVDEKLKITLDDNGLLYKPGKMGEAYNITYKDAIETALTRSTNWAQFKNALAEEIVFKWFTDRMSPSKESTDKNTNFRTSYDEWVYQINKDYDNTVQTCKNKYGANWPFYLQNEYLAPLGGTEESYKHAKLVEKIKADFLSKVFAKSYFGYKQESDATIYPHIYTKATKDVNKNTLRNPANWSNIGFFARAELSFDPGETPKSYPEVMSNYLARHPDGDYAAIQDYVFNRWFKTEKPMFVSAALFKYSNPKYVAGGKLDQIYDGTRTGVKVPTDKPSEAFPFFGIGDDCSTAKAKQFLTDMANGKLATDYTDDAGKKVLTNGTITIPLSDSEDGQTCLLVCGNQMFTALYTPYAMAVGNLYYQMMNYKYQHPNTITATEVATNFEKYKGDVDDFAMLSNFFYQADPRTKQSATINSVLDLQEVYGGTLKGTGEAGDPYEYHCPLFSECKTYPYFYGNTSAEGTFQDGAGKYWSNKTGIKYITNNLEIKDFQSTETTITPAQPWVMELNEAGVHCLTIDGYNYVVNAGSKEEDRLANLKKVVMFRLMQKQINDDSAACISTDLLGESGKLKTYFNDNFTNIVLELAMYNNTETQFSKYNVFRTIDSYKVDPSETKDENLFLYNIWKDESLGTAYTDLILYVKDLIDFENLKKVTSTIETANNKIYAYRSKQVTGSKAKEGYSKAIFENGLLAPFVYRPYKNAENNWMYDYPTVNKVVIMGDYQDKIVNGAYASLYTALTGIVSHNYVKDVLANAQVNGSTGFSPQIATAKSKTSNRFWYKSGLVDKVMYGYMGNKAATANAIKMNAYQYYVAEHDKDGEWFGTNIQEPAGKFFTPASSKNAFLTTYARTKVLTTDKTLAHYVTTPDEADTAAKFYDLMSENFIAYMQKAGIDNGLTGDDWMNLALFRATMMYLVGSQETDPTKAKPFDNFYTVFNSKIGDDESAIVGYMTKGYNVGSDHTLVGATPKVTEDAATDYNYNPDVDNIFDLHGYEGDDSRSSEKTEEGKRDNVKLSGSSYWNIVQKSFKGLTKPKDFAGFLGLQTKASNQLDSASGLQSAVFGKLAKATFESINIEDGSKYEQNHGCWFQFGGKLNARGGELSFDDFTYGGTTVKCDEWFPKDTDYVNVRKVAKKIIEYRTMDDLRSLARTLADAYDGYTYFSAIADGSLYCDNVNDMKMKMLKLLPSKQVSPFEHQHDINTFQRITNAEAHTAENQPSYVFKDTKGKNTYKLLLTQVNKADALEKTLAPTWDEGTKTWVQGNSPITPEEFWAIFFNLATEATVQQRAITEIVKYTFGDEKLIVYDAQLYNQFDSVWIKDWTKKTMGA